MLKKCLKFSRSAGSIKSIYRSYCYKPIKRVSLDDLPKDRVRRESVSAEKEKTATLAAQLQAKIKFGGPITVAQYMKEVLTNPAAGYYMLKDVFGRDGDFITSPEVTQIFGELVGVWCINEWKKMGSPQPLQLVELGPGRGTLTEDILRVFHHFNAANRLSLHLVEVSPYLAKLQSQVLCHMTNDAVPDPEKGITYYREGESISGVKVYWYDKLENVPRKFSIYIAHEFFDALPIHKFQKIEGKGWREILIDIDRADENKFRLITAENETPHLKLFQSRNLGEESRDHVEYSSESEIIIKTLADRLEYNGGFSLLVDYGHFGDKGDTFRSFRNHKLHDPLNEPGAADLTADVDFSQIKRFAEEDDRLITYGPVEQRDFLHRMGGEFRMNYLLEKATAENIDVIRSGYDMLTNPEKMGKRFKFFAMYPTVLENILKKCPPAGFTD